MDLTTFTIDNVGSLLRQGEITSLELTEAYLSRIEQLNPILNAFITVTAETALSQAHSADRRLQRYKKMAERDYSPLLGIPITLKDLYETRKILTTAGSLFFKDYIPTQDAFTVEKLKRAGAVILGKTHMHEIALGVTNNNPHFGACRNPWDLDRVTGGSSGGSAAALAADLCLGSMGTDSGGSIRIPSSLCGIVGLKPTYGRVSLRGVIPLSWSTDHAGPMARTVRDVVQIFQVVDRFDPVDPYSIRKIRFNRKVNLEAGIKDWRIALATDEYFAPSDPQVIQAVQNAAAVFGRLGGHVEQVEFKGLLAAAQANLLMVTSEAAAYHHDRLLNQPEKFGEDILRRLLSGASHTSIEYILARRTQMLLRRQFEAFFSKFDLLMMPTTPVTAPLIEGPDAVEQARLLTRYTAPFNLTGLPAISLPCGFSDRGLPIGLQIIARPWAETQLLRAAYAFEEATQWHQEKPIIEKI